MTIIEEMRADGVRVVEKTHWFWTLLHWCLVIVTLGKNRGFLLNYYTTVGLVVSIPRGLSTSNADPAVLAHEWEHVRQCRALGFGNAWVGLPLFAFLYLFCLPFGLSWFRYSFERRAYVVGIEYELRHMTGMLPSGKAARREQLIEFSVEQLTGPNYAWTWPFKKSVARWFDQNVGRIPVGAPLKIVK